MPGRLQDFISRIPAVYGRRKVISAAVCLGSAVVLGPMKVRASSARVIDVSTYPGVDPSGGSDSSTGFNNALAALQSLGGGQLFVPPGFYKIGSPLTYSGSSSTSLEIVGCGQTLSQILVPTAETVLSVTVGAACNFTIRDIGFSPLANGGSGTALSITGPGSAQSTQAVVIENVDFCAASFGYTAFSTALALRGLSNVNVRNANMHSNAGVISGGCFVNINACLNVRFNNCSIDVVDTGFFVSGYCQGIHLIDCVTDANVGIYTGNVAYSGNGSTTPVINLLGLYVDNCEFQCTTYAAYLFAVYTAWVANTHLGGASSNVAAVTLMGCTQNNFNTCTITSMFNSGTPTLSPGLSTNGISNWNCNETVINGCLFTNCGLAIKLGAGTFNLTAKGVRLSYVSDLYLVGNPASVGPSFVMAVVQDGSGNSTNEVQWIASQAGSNSTTDRFLYSMPN